MAALGGNALLRRGEPLDAQHQLANVKLAAAAVSGLCVEHDVVVTHGNGPQVGLLALEAEAYPAVDPYPLDVLGAETEGMTGYLLQQELANELPGREVVTLLTRVEVDPADPAFATPDKPVGPMYRADQLEALRVRPGWTIRADGDAFRRVVPSPAPQRVLGLQPIRMLLEAGVIVVCAGGGGIPIVTRRGRSEGVEGVIDKDWTSALLADGLGADLLLLLTDVDAVVDGWGTPSGRKVRCGGAEAMAALGLASGSMAPKVGAAAWFARRGGRAVIGSLLEAEALVAGSSGTAIVGDGPITYWDEPDH